MRKAKERADALREHARLVARPDGGVAQRLADLLPVYADIHDALDEASAAEAEATRRVERAALAAAAAAEVGESVEDLAAAAELLRSVRHTLADLEAADLAARQEQAELDAASAALLAEEAALPDLEAAARAAGEAASAAAASLESQRELGRQVREALRAAREAAAASDTAVAAERRRREALPSLERQLAERRSLVGEAESAVEVRRRALEEAQRRDAAAHAAEGLGPGDPCPVCGRRLSEEFQPPSAGALRPLRQAMRDAEAELATRRAAETTAATQLDEGERRLAEAVSQREAGECGARDRLEALHLVAPAADLGLDDSAVLGPIDDRAHGLDVAAAGTGREAEQTRGRLLATRAGLDGRRTDRDQRARRLDRERERVRDQRDRCEQRVRTLPRALSVEKMDRPIDLDEAIAAAGRRLDEAKRERAELDDLRAGVGRLARVRSDLHRRLQDDLEGPRSLAMRSAAELLLRVGDGLAMLGRPSPEAAPDEATIEAEVRWAAELDRGAAELRRHLDEAIAECDRAGAKAAAELGRRLAESGLQEADGLDEELRLVSRELGRVQSGVEMAEAQIPQAADLDGWIETGVAVRDSLLELARLLQDAQFVGHVIERRQRQLLIVASQILGSMTGDAYGFASDFEIVDRSTNQPRPTRTLSGGETFLASLALALALVEMAGRSGTQLDALFLDEGFGSLDADALDEALSALELQASEGRLVAVVSHVRAVAERIETVLEVTRTAAGSRAGWRGGAERELMLAEELEGRLLA